MVGQFLCSLSLFSFLFLSFLFLFSPRSERQYEKKEIDRQSVPVAFATTSARRMELGNARLLGKGGVLLPTCPANKIQDTPQKKGRLLKLLVYALAVRLGALSIAAPVECSLCPVMSDPVCEKKLNKLKTQSVAANI